MKNNLSFVIQLEKNGHFTAIAVAVPKNQNLYHHFDSYNTNGAKIVVVQYCETWTKAIRLEQEWNAGFLANHIAWTNKDYAD